MEGKLVKAKKVCPRCGEKEGIYSNGPQWYCKRCDKQWMKIKFVEKKKFRPVCKYCGLKEMLSNGDKWRCGNCGKSYFKIAHPRVLKEGPPCLECEGKTRSAGMCWRCQECGRHFVKNPRVRGISIEQMIGGKYIEA